MSEAGAARANRIWRSLPFHAQGLAVLFLPLPCAAVSVVAGYLCGVFSIGFTLSAGLLFEFLAAVCVLYAAARRLEDVRHLSDLVRRAESFPAVEPGCWEMHRLRLNLEAISGTIEEQRRALDQCERAPAPEPLPRTGTLASNGNFREALNGVNGFTELLYDGKVGPVSAEQRECLGYILESARSLWRMADDLDDLPPLGVPSDTAGLAEGVDLMTLIAEVRFAMTARGAGNVVPVCVEIDPAIGRVFVDRVRFRRVAHSFLESAMHSPSRPSWVTLRVRPAGDSEFRLEVADNCVVIGQHERGDVELRYPVHEFGRAFAKHVVELEGGRVGVFRSPACGTVTYAILPCRAAEAAIMAVPGSREDNWHGPAVQEQSPDGAIPIVGAPTRRTA